MGGNLFARYQNLSIISALHHVRVRGKQGQVVGKDLEEERSERGTLEYTNEIGLGSGKVPDTTPVSRTNRLCMATEVRRKPGRSDAIGLKLGQNVCVVDNVEAFGRSRRQRRGISCR